MTDILRPLLIIIFLTISLAAYFLVINTLFPSRVEKTQRIISQMPWRALGVGRGRDRLEDGLDGRLGLLLRHAALHDEDVDQVRLEHRALRHPGSTGAGPVSVGASLAEPPKISKGSAGMDR